MTRLEELARAVEDGSAREHDVKELARLVLEAERKPRAAFARGPGGGAVPGFGCMACADRGAECFCFDAKETP